MNLFCFPTSEEISINLNSGGEMGVPCNLVSHLSRLFHFQIFHNFLFPPLSSPVGNPTFCSLLSHLPYITLPVPFSLGSLPLPVPPTSLVQLEHGAQDALSTDCHLAINKATVYQHHSKTQSKCQLNLL